MLVINVIQLPKEINQLLENAGHVHRIEQGLANSDGRGGKESEGLLARDLHFNDEKLLNLESTIK